MVAGEDHLRFVTQINDAIDEAAKQRGTGIARRTDEYIADKINSGKAIIAVNRDEFVGFCYIESWGHDEFVANSGLIVRPQYRGMGVAKRIKQAAFELSRKRFPNAKLFGLTTGEAVMRINTELGYEPVTFAKLTDDEAFWAGCQSCVNYDVLQRTNMTKCLCTGMIYDPEKLGAIAVAAYSYMALVPVIQPPIMRLLTTKKERAIKMEQLRTVSKREKIIFPIVVTILVAFIVPDATALVGMLMLGNLFKESGVVDRLVKTAQNELMNIVTIMLGVTVGATATAENFLSVETLAIILMGLVAFCIGTSTGVLFAKLMNLFCKKKINPLIGSAGVSAVPMAARVSQKVGAETNPSNFLLMHAMGPNVAGVIGSAVAAGALLSIFG